jgi:molybdopterin-synthase adenylyltransferase
VIRSAALTSDTFEQLAAHLIRLDGQEDLCFALWRPSTGATRTTAIVSEPILPLEGERRVHGNASFFPQYLDRALGIALERRAGLALMHSHPGPGWQGMSADDVSAESNRAASTSAATGLPLVGLTIGNDGALSARFWEKSGPREYERRWCETVRVVGGQLLVTFDEAQRPPPVARATQVRTLSAWGDDAQAVIARLRVGIVGAGSVGSIVAEALARTGVQHIRLIDFDGIEEHNLDRLLHAHEADVGKAKVAVLRQALYESTTARDPLFEMLELSVCEEAGFRAALDCDVLFSCVDRPWPRKVLNIVAYAHLIPVIDGGIRVASPSGHFLKRADWKTLTAVPGRICLECSSQFDPADVMLERDGALDDPHYIETLPEDHHLRRRENVFAFSASLASLEVMQMLAMIVAPHGISNPGVQTYHFVSGTLDQEWPQCYPDCIYNTRHLGTGDAAVPGTVAEHEIAELARQQRWRGASTGAPVGRPWWRRLTAALTRRRSR